MNRLYVDNRALARFANLASAFSHSHYSESEIEAKVETRNLKFYVFQIERHEKDIECGISISDGNVKFIWSDVAQAILGGNNKYTNPVRTNGFVLETNNQRLNLFVDFCETCRNSLHEWPPSWFLEASKNAVDGLTPNFPSLAQQMEKEHKILWKKWKEME